MGANSCDERSVGRVLPVKDNWEEIGNAAVESPGAVLVLIFHKIFNTIFDVFRRGRNERK